MFEDSDQGRQPRAGVAWADGFVLDQWTTIGRSNTWWRSCHDEDDEEEDDDGGGGDDDEDEDEDDEDDDIIVVPKWFLNGS